MITGNTIHAVIEKGVSRMHRGKSGTPKLARTTGAVLGVLVLLAAVMPVPRACSQDAVPPPDWSRWQPFLGEWQGEGGGQPGQGIGGFTFSADLRGRVLVRRNSAEYPATADMPAFSHEDLMVVYREADSTRALYVDNEGHVIHYGVTFSPDSASIIYLSAGVPAEPQYRLTTTILRPGSVRITFEIARPGTVRVFTKYLEATAIRKK